MSKIGVQPIIIPSGVSIAIDPKAVTVTGVKGVIAVPIPRDIHVVQADANLVVSRKGNDKKIRAMHGLIRASIMNAVIGVVTEWEKGLEVQGVGYKVTLEGSNALVFKVGFTHSVRFEVPKGIAVEVKGNKISLRGMSRQFVGETAAKIKAIRKPDKYKGKGIRYAGEVIKLKPGKKAKAGA